MGVGLCCASKVKKPLVIGYILTRFFVLLLYLRVLYYTKESKRAL